MEDTISSTNHETTDAGELKNSLVESTNGDQDSFFLNGISTQLNELGTDNGSTNEANALDTVNDIDSNNDLNNSTIAEPTELSNHIGEVEASAGEAENVPETGETENVPECSEDYLNNTVGDAPETIEQSELDKLVEAAQNVYIEEPEEPEVKFADIIAKEEPDLLEFDEFGNASVLSSLTISNIFTDVTEGNDTTAAQDKENNAVKPKKSSLMHVTPACKKIIKKVVKQARTLSSPEFLWVLIQLTPKCVNETTSDEKKKIHNIIEKLVSEDSKKSITDLLSRVQNFTTEEYAALYQRLSSKRHKETPTECVKEFNQSIMFFKTHLEVELESTVNKAELYKDYTSYCSSLLLKPLKSAEIYQILRTIYPMVREKRLDAKGGKRYLFSGIKKRDKLHLPKLPKFAEDQLHNNFLISQYMSCHDCCSLYSSIVLDKTSSVGRPKLKIKFQGMQSKSSITTSSAPLDESSIKVHDPLDLLNISKDKTVAVTESVVPDTIDLTVDSKPKKLNQVAKKSCSKRIKKVPLKYREFTATFGDKSPSTLKALDKTPTNEYTEKLINLKEKLSRFVITKAEYGSRYKVSCNCCLDVYYVTERHGLDLLAMQKKLEDCALTRSPKRLSKIRRNYHTSVKRLYHRYDNLILPETVVYDDIDPTISLDRFGVYNWFQTEISTLKRKMLENALNSLNSSSRRHRYEPKVFGDSSSSTSTPTKIIPPHPPIYISAVRETPKETLRSEAPKIAEVFIKAEANKVGPGRKRSTHEPEVIEISAQKRPRPSHSVINPMYSRSRHVPYNRRKESDFIYFPAIDTSSGNLRLANLGTLYKCILCLMLFNTKQKLADHERAHCFCHKCRRNLRDVEIMRQHLIKHCQRNQKKRKPILKIHRVDSIEIMIKKYGESFEASKAYYREAMKPKKKYREMIRPKVEPLPPPPAIEEVIVQDVKPNIQLLPEIPTNEMKPLQSVDGMPILTPVTMIPVSTPSTQNSIFTMDGIANYVVLSSNVNGQVVQNEPPKLVFFPPASSTVTNIKKEPSPPPPNPPPPAPSTQKSFKIRVKDLIELS